MPTCCVVGCSSRSSTHSHRVKFFRFPNDRKSIVQSERTNKRQIAWLGAINRLDLKGSSLKHLAICSEHFLTGRPAVDSNTQSPDWIPTLRMGHQPTGKDLEGDIVKWTAKGWVLVWTDETTLHLIELWREQPSLYNPTHRLYGVKEAVVIALAKITEGMKPFVENITQEDIDLRMGSLSTYYFQKLKEQQDRKKTSTANDNIYEPWFSKLSFLNDFPGTGEINDLLAQCDKSVGKKANIIENTLLSPLIDVDSAGIKQQLSIEIPKEVLATTSKGHVFSREADTEVLTDISDPLSITTARRMTNFTATYPDEIQVFGEHVKAEMVKVFDAELQDEAMLEINNIVFEMKTKQRLLNL